MINDLVISFDEVQHAVLYDVDWAFYNELLRRAENRNVRLTYDNGTLEIMSPLAEHESWKKRLASLIEVLAMELRLPMRRLGSTTYRRENLQKGLEPDECYYIQHVAQVKNKRRIDLDRDPPPDLVIEIELTSSTLAKAPIYASLGVPELWRFNGRQLRILRLGPGGYTESDRSLCLPMLLAADLMTFLNRFAAEDDETAIVCDWQSFVRTHYLNP